jgi:hypothetical protein
MCCGGAAARLGQAPTRIDGYSGAEPDPAVRFVYTGRTSLDIVGSTTRRLYRFEGTGAALDVDRRDAYGFSALPMLRRATDDRG